MRKFAAIILGTALVACNDVMNPGPPVQSTHDGTPALVTYVGLVAQDDAEQYVIYPNVQPQPVLLEGNEEQLAQLGQLVGVEAVVKGYMEYDGVLWVVSCEYPTLAAP